MSSVTQQDFNVIGIDYGLKRVGVALGHNIARLPRPYRVVANDEELIPHLEQIIRDENVRHIVLGLPIPLSGQRSEQTKLTGDFGGKLQSFFELPLSYVDEALSSAEAENVIGPSSPVQRVDAHAAAAILERYFAGEGMTKKEYEDRYDSSKA